MSAPEFQTQDQVRMANDNIVKFKEGWKMKVATKVTKAKMTISRSLETQRPVKLVGILVLGALFIAGTAVQFASGPDEESVNDSSVEKVEVVSNPTDLGAVDSEYRFMALEDEPLSVEFLRTYVYPEERPGRSETQTDYHREINRLEGEISAMLAEAREDPSTDPLQLDRELRQLDHQIDLLRLAAMEQQ